jgi:hypothetical protein
MTAAATHRNATAVADGRATFVIGDVPAVELPGPPCDHILAARVAAMTRPECLAWAHDHLAPGGRLSLVVDAPDGRRTRGHLDALATILPAAGYAVAAVTTTSIDGALVACVTAARL